MVQKTQSGSSRLGSTVKDFANYLAKKKEFKKQVLWTYLLKQKESSQIQKVTAAQYRFCFKPIIKRASVIRQRDVKF